MRPRPEEVAVAIDRRLERGTYTVAWRVISADSDPINGAWVFHVEAPGAQPSGSRRRRCSRTRRSSLGVLSQRPLPRLHAAAGCVGGMVALVFALRYASAPVRRRLLGIVAAAAAALTVVPLVGLGLQGAAAGGAGLGEGFRWESVSSVADTRFGNFALLRAGLAAALCVVALIARARITLAACVVGERRSRAAFCPAAGAIPRRSREADRCWNPQGAGRGGGSGRPGRTGTGAPAGNGPGKAVVQAQGSVGATPAGREAGRAVTATTVAALILGRRAVVTPGLSGHASVSGRGLGGRRRRARPRQRRCGRAGWRSWCSGWLFTSRGRRWELAATSVPRFSTMAVVSVACLIVAGDDQRLSAGARLAWALGDRVRGPVARKDRARPPAARHRCLQQPPRRPAPARADRLRGGAPPLPSHGRRGAR